MVFLSIALRYLAFCAPVLALYAFALRRPGTNPKFAAYGWTTANLVIVGYLVYWGTTSGGVTLVRSLLYAVGATFVVLLPVVFLMVLVAGRREERARAEPED